MYVWELVACRLRAEGWNVWHTTREEPCGPSYTVHLQRRGLTYEVWGPTLTEAYAAGARRVREETAEVIGGPYFARMPLAART